MKLHASIVAVAAVVAATFLSANASGGVLNESQKLIASDGAAGDRLGRAVSVDADIAIVGAPEDDGGIGSAYIFYRNQGGIENWGQVTKITANDGAVGDLFGISVSVSGDTALVGARLGDGVEAGSGAAYVFRRNEGGSDNWGQVTKITASDGSGVGGDGDWFGHSVAIDADTAIVGAVRDDDNGFNSGSVYVYERDHGGIDNWGEVTKVTASNGAANDDLGGAVAISGDVMIAGAIGDDDNGSSSGSAYLYSRDEGGIDNWGEVKQILASDGLGSDHFGISVAIGGNTAIVGAHQAVNSGTGAAYVYQQNEGGVDNWGEATKLTASDATANDSFGSSVGLSGDTTIVGARRNDDNGGDSGSAYVFLRDEGGVDNWGEVIKISASDGAAGDEFGISAALSVNTAIVGAFLDDENGSESGSAYVFNFGPGEAIPAASAWGLAAMTLLVLAAGTVVLRRSGAASA